MALYNNSAFGPPYKSVGRLGTAIEPNYLFGSRDYKTEPMLFQITNLALTSNIVTATVAIKSGGGAANVLPSVGAKMGVHGTAASGGAFNVDPTTVLSSTVSATTGAGTITYALTHADVAGAAAAGDLIVQSFEQPDLVASGTASAPFALVFTPDESDNARCLFAECIWTGTMPTSATVSLQVANVDDDARYQSMPTPIGTVAGGAVTQSGNIYSFLIGKFIRAKVTAMTGGDGTTGLICTVFA